jgi:hypothetical protein
MKKVQLPVLGGLRKVIYPGGTNPTVGTTIAEIGAGTITLAQLAAAINNILNNTGTTVPPGTPTGDLVLGPGLAGGGPLIGNVPLRLTAPIPWMGDDGGGGGDGDPGPPGMAGPAGAAGPQGPSGPLLMHMIPEDGADGEPSMIPGPIGPQGIAGGTGATGAPGAALFMLGEDGADGDIGPPGAAGATGPQGPQGPAGSSSGGGLAMMIPDDAYWDEPIPLLPSALGYVQMIMGLRVGPDNILMGTQTSASIIFPGATPIISANVSGAVLQVISAGSIQFGINAQTQELILQSSGNLITQNTGAFGGTTQFQVINTASAQTGGMIVQAGNSNSNYNMLLTSANGTTTFVEVWGDGGVTVGASSKLLDEGPGTINVQSGLFVNGVKLGSSGSVPYAVPEDPYWEEEILKGVPSGLGPTTVNSQLTVNGNPGVALSGAEPLVVNAGAQFAVLLNSVSTAAGAVAGFVMMQAGSALGEWGLDASNTMTGDSVNGDTVIRSVGKAIRFTTNGTTSNLAVLATATVCAQSLGAKGSTPAVTAGQTDIGTTTTGTVITTAGGIALPALASTFWVVNVNGVSYGVPCFAL